MREANRIRLRAAAIALAAGAVVAIGNPVQPLRRHIDHAAVSAVRLGTGTLAVVDRHAQHLLAGPPVSRG